MENSRYKSVVVVEELVRKNKAVSFFFGKAQNHFGFTAKHSGKTTLAVLALVFTVITMYRPAISGITSNIILWLLDRKLFYLCIDRHYPRRRTLAFWSSFGQN